MNWNLCRGPEASGSRWSQFTDGAIHLLDLEATQALGTELAQRLPAGAILLLKGPLGAGKTSLVQGIALALGVSEPITISQEHEVVDLQSIFGYNFGAYAGSTKH